MPWRLLAAAASDTNAAEALLRDFVTERKIAGAVAAIGTRERLKFIASGRIAFANSAAAADPDSLWRIYSMTKLVTGPAAMLLVEGGKLAIDAPVAEFFPTFGSPRVLVGSPSSATRPADSIMTVRHLMTHSSGLVGSRVPEPPLSTFYADRKLNVSRVSVEEDSEVGTKAVSGHLRTRPEPCPSRLTMGHNGATGFPATFWVG
jgi:CubicO group peptidase (beta-lactamase class C family)